MDGSDFDALIRALARPLSRRVTLAGLAAGALAALGLGLDEAPVLAKKGKKKKKKGCTACGGGRVCRDGACRPCRDTVIGTETECQRHYGLNSPWCVQGRCRQCVAGHADRGDFWCEVLWVGERPYCVGTSCRECRGDGDCPAERPACLDGACFQHCGDGLLNGDESDLDCGGRCAKCINGRNCFWEGDCESGRCDDGVCLACAEQADCPVGRVCTTGGTCSACANSSVPVIDDSACPAASRCGPGDCWCTETAGGARECLHHGGVSCFDADDCEDDDDCAAGRFCAKVAGCCGNLTLRRACLSVCSA